MAVPVVRVVHVVAVDDRLVAAARPVHVGMPGVGQVRERMLARHCWVKGSWLNVTRTMEVKDEG